ncbi:MAG: alpha/beta hydrolase [Gemmatimonadota bacterium]
MTTRPPGSAIRKRLVGLVVLGVVVLAASTPSGLRFLAHWGVRGAEALRPGVESDKPHDPALYGQREVADIVGLMDHVGVERAHLVGYSHGSRLSQHALDRFPERFITATLGGYGSRPDGSGPMESLSRDRAADSLRAGSLGPIIRALTPPPASPSRRTVAVANGVISARNDMLALAAAFQAEPPPLPPVRNARITVPTLMLIGELDDVAGAESLTGMMPDARMHVVPEAGHLGAPGTTDFDETLVGFLRARASGQP